MCSGRNKFSAAEYFVAIGYHQLKYQIIEKLLFSSKARLSRDFLLPVRRYGMETLYRDKIPDRQKSDRN